MEKSLVQIINGSDGYIRTAYPKETSSGRWEGYPEHNSNAELDLRKVAGIDPSDWDGSEIEIVVTFEYEQSPEILVGDFVDTYHQNRWQASFFHNSGIKIENRAEIQIFDTQSLLHAIDGSTETIDGAVENVTGSVTDINSTGSVQLDHGAAAWYDEPADKVINLVTGKPYEYDDKLSTETYMDRLERAPMGGQEMTIHVTRDETPGGPFDFEVTIGEEDPKTYEDIPPNGNPMATNLVYLQSHWGSGVKFADVKVRKL